MDRKEMARRINRRPLAYIAFWQFMAFILLICLIWVNEIMDIQSFFFGGPQSPPNLFRGLVLTVGSLVCAVITIGNTYIQQRKIISGLLVICSGCKKVSVGHDVWQRIEQYVETRSLAVFSHGLCPDCHAQMIDRMGQDIAANSNNPGKSKSRQVDS